MGFVAITEYGSLLVRVYRIGMMMKFATIVSDLNNLINEYLRESGRMYNLKSIPLGFSVPDIVLLFESLSNLVSYYSYCLTAFNLS